MTITPQRLDEIEEANARLRAEGHPQEVREELCAALREAWRERDQRIALHDFAVNQRNTMFGEALKVIAEERDSLAALVGEIKHSHRGCSIAPIPAPAALEALTRRIRGEVETNLALWTDERVRTFRAGVERLTRAEVWREAAKLLGLTIGAADMREVCPFEMRSLHVEFERLAAAAEEGR